MDIRALECVHADSSALGVVNKSEKVRYRFGSADADSHLSRRALSTRLQPACALLVFDKLVTVTANNVVSDFTTINFLYHYAALTWLVHLRREEHRLRCPPLCYVLPNHLSADLLCSVSGCRCS